MNTAINGIGAGNANSSGMAGTKITMKKSGVTTGKNKRTLHYNPKELSAQLARATKARNASQVLSRAKNKVSSLSRCLGSGQYNDTEVRVALAHARKMVQCAQMKVANLREEERIAKQNKREQQTEEQKRKTEIKRRVAQKEQQLKMKDNIEVNQKLLKEKAKRQALVQKTKMHRRQEQQQLNKADMEYLEDRVKNRDSISYTPIGSNVCVELSAQAIDLQLSEHAQQILAQQVLGDVSEAGTGAMAEIGEV